MPVMIAETSRGRRRALVGVMALTLALVTGLAAVAPAMAKTLRAGPAIKAELGLSGPSGWLVVDLDTREILDHANSTRSFVPASVAKLPTAAFALDALGPAYRFETRVLAGGPVRGGRLGGDLILSGGGDPELDTDALAALAQELKRRGVRRVTGRFLVDGTALPRVREIEPTQSEAASYNPSVSGLNLNYNRVHVTWDARKGRNSLRVEAVSDRMSPAVDGVRVAVVSAPVPPVFRLEEQGGREVWQMSAKAFRGRAARWLPVKNPEAYAGEVFRTLAGAEGIALGPATVARHPARGEVLASRQSRALGDIVRDMLRFSTNLTAEALGMAATRAVGVEATALADSAAVMNAWAGMVAGFAPGDPGFDFANHSGLSLDGRVSPQRMVDFLTALARRADPAGAAHPRLPGGIAGYLKTHNVRDDAVPIDYDRLEVVAKTGTMSYVRGLAGYIATPGGRRLAFAIFSNDLSRRSRRGERVDRGWMSRARKFERALIREWVLAADAAR